MTVEFKPGDLARVLTREAGIWQNFGPISDADMIPLGRVRSRELVFVVQVRSDSISEEALVISSRLGVVGWVLKRFLTSA